VAASGYLALLAGLSFFGATRPRASVKERARLTVVVPAHNEEQLLPALLACFKAQTYPSALFAVHVIADNCTDATPSIARHFGVNVHERHAPEAPGKGQAIAWLLPLLPGDADAYVFVDADSTVGPSFLEALNESLQDGHPALQASYRVADPDSAPLVTLRALAFALIHEVRGRAKLALGVACGIWGNGFVLRREQLEEVGWSAFSGVEDAEQHLRIVLSGASVRFVPEATVLGHMPATFRTAESQQRRWEAGRLALLRRWSGPLMCSFIRTGNSSVLVAALELALPPLSVVVALVLLGVGLAVAVGSLVQLIASLVAAACLGFYIMRGLMLCDLKASSYLSLWQAPRYVLWKLLLYARELQRGSEPAAWIRTAREKPPEIPISSERGPSAGRQ
jgi:cellulose synthase/poly-beta-1,6-N-acetylglucosamine synthase-like glycosyltransferase